MVSSQHSSNTVKGEFKHQSTHGLSLIEHQIKKNEMSLLLCTEIRRCKRKQMRLLKMGYQKTLATLGTRDRTNTSNHKNKTHRIKLNALATRMVLVIEERQIIR